MPNGVSDSRAHRLDFPSIRNMRVRAVALPAWLAGVACLIVLPYSRAAAQVGTAGAKFTQTLKTALKSETARYLIAKGWYQWELRPIENTANFRQLLLTDNRLDVYKFQMLIFTVIVALYILSAGQTGLEGVKISDTMIYLLGISQLVYVGGKAVTDRTTDLEEAVAKMRELEPKLNDAKPEALTPEQRQALDEYGKAAKTAAEEFAFLQNRIYPRANPADPNSSPAPTVLVPKPDLAPVGIVGSPPLFVLVNV